MLLGLRVAEQLDLVPYILKDLIKNTKTGRPKPVGLRVAAQLALVLEKNLFLETVWIRQGPQADTSRLYKNQSPERFRRRSAIKSTAHSMGVKPVLMTMSYTLGSSGFLEVKILRN